MNMCGFFRAIVPSHVETVVLFAARVAEIIIDVAGEWRKCPTIRCLWYRHFSGDPLFFFQEVSQMDLMKIGRFIAVLRKENGLTQEQLGERIGVTNKTVSRWETGVYLPPADMLLALGELFHVNVNEILSGKRLTDAEYKKAAEENLTQAIKASSFSLKDKIEFFKKKWLKEHIAIMVVIGICIIAVLIVGILIKNLVLISITPILILAAHAWRNNTMMAYVERKVYDENGN